jgi:mono/diheme cytochrome c family protein
MEKPMYCSLLLIGRYTTQPWLQQLKAVVPELTGPVTTFKDAEMPNWTDVAATDTKVAAVNSLASYVASVQKPTSHPSEKQLADMRQLLLLGRWLRASAGELLVAIRP